MTTNTDSASKARLTERGQAYIGGRGLLEERKTVGNCIIVPSLGSKPHPRTHRSKFNANSQKAHFNGLKRPGPLDD